MRLCKVRLNPNEIAAGWIDGEQVRLLRGSLIEILHAASPAQAVQQAVDPSRTPMPLEQAKLMTPLDNQEVWAAGVTYKRSQEARERESAGAARFYDLVYSAPRPELFFKAPAYRVVASRRTGPHPPRQQVERPGAGTRPRHLAAAETGRLHRRQRHELARHRRRKPALPAPGEILRSRLRPRPRASRSPMPCRSRTTSPSAWSSNAAARPRSTARPRSRR